MAHHSPWKSWIQYISQGVNRRTVTWGCQEGFETATVGWANDKAVKNPDSNNTSSCMCTNSIGVPGDTLAYQSSINIPNWFINRCPGLQRNIHYLELKCEFKNSRTKLLTFSSMLAIIRKKAAPPAREVMMKNHTTASRGWISARYFGFCWGLGATNTM